MQKFIFLLSLLSITSQLSYAKVDLEIFQGISTETPGVPVSPEYGTVDGIRIYQEPTKIADVPWQCFKGAYSILASGCQRSEDLEVALEVEFWGHVMNTDVEGMETYITKSLAYADTSGTPYKSRIYKLVGFGYSMIFGANPVAGGTALKGIGSLLKSNNYLSQVIAMEPNDTAAIYNKAFIDAFMAGALNNTELYLQKIESIKDFVDLYGKVGYEGTSFFGLMSLFVSDEEIVREGLELMGDCTDFVCAFRPTQAPYRKLGNMMGMIEASWAIGEEEKAKQLTQAAYDWLVEVNAPAILFDRIQELKDSMEQGDIVKRWQGGKENIGIVRMPVGTFQTSANCLTCHIGVRVLPEYYQYKTMP